MKELNCLMDEILMNIAEFPSDYKSVDINITERITEFETMVSIIISNEAASNEFIEVRDVRISTDFLQPLKDFADLVNGT